MAPKSAYEHLSPEDKEAVNLMIYVDLAQRAVRGSLALQGALALGEMAELAPPGVQVESTNPALYADLENIIEVQRELFADDRAAMKEARELSAVLRMEYREKGVPFGPREATQRMDTIIAIDGDQFDVQKELPNIRARRQLDKSI